MKRLIEFAASLYPAKWQTRYGAEFQALVEDLQPGWRVFFNVLGGALKMRLFSGETLYIKLAVAFALVGITVALTIAQITPREYSSSAMLRVAPGSEQQLFAAIQQVTCRACLARLLSSTNLNLYPDEQLRIPMEDVIAKMGSDVAIQLVPQKEPGLAVRVTYHYRDQHKAQAVVSEIVGNLFASFASRQVGRHDLSVIEPADLPLTAVVSHRAEFMLVGLTLGTIFGLLAALTIRQTRRTLLVAATASVGCVLGIGFAQLVPDRYISTAVVRIVPTDRSGALRTAQWLKDRSLSNPHGLTLQLSRPGKMPVTGALGATAMVITFEAQDPTKAQAMVEATALQLTGLNHDVELLDNASFPKSPDFPNRAVIAELGFAWGFLLGLTYLWVTRRSAAGFLAGQNFPSVPPSSRC